MSVRINRLLKKLKKGLAEIYGEKLDAVYLYGSYARGEARSDSDIDILILIKGRFNYIEMLKRSDDFVASLCLQNDVVISRAFVSVQEYKAKQTPFLINVRRDGVPV